MKSLAATASLVALLAAAPSFAQSPSPPPQGDTGGAQAQAQVNQQDRDFLREAGMGGRAEIEMGRLAMKNAADPAIQEFGRWMVTDHTAIDEALSRLAARLGVPPAEAIDRSDQATKERLQALSGAAFDREYIQLQVKDHQQAIALFEHEVRAGEEPVLKAVVQRAIPMIRQHLDEAEELAKLPAVASGAAPATGSSVAPQAPVPSR